MFRSLTLFTLTLVLGSPLCAEAPVLSVPPSAPAAGMVDRSEPAAWQANMPSLEIIAAFVAEKEDRGPNGEHIPRANTEFASGEEIYFYVSMGNVARDPVGMPGARFEIALRAQIRSEAGDPLSPWLDIHTYEGTMTMSPDHPEYFQSWITGGLGPELPPGEYQLALEFTDLLRTEPAAQAPVEVVFELVYP